MDPERDLAHQTVSSKRRNFLRGICFHELFAAFDERYSRANADDGLASGAVRAHRHQFRVNQYDERRKYQPVVAGYLPLVVGTDRFELCGRGESVVAEAWPLLRVRYV